VGSIGELTVEDILAAMPVGVRLVDGNGARLYENERAARLAQEAEPATFTRPLPGGRAMQIFAEAAGTGAFGPRGGYSLKILRGDGTVRFVLDPSRHPAVSTGAATPGAMCAWFNAAYPPHDRTPHTPGEVRTVCLRAEIDGQDRALEVSFIAVEGDNGVGEYVCITHDRTELDVVARLSRQVGLLEVEEVRHRLRNHLQGLISAVRLQGFQESTAEAREAVGRVEQRLDRLNRLHHLLDGEVGRDGFASAPVVLRQSIDAQMSFYPVQPKMVVSIDEIRLSRSDLSLVGRIVSELLCNALTHAFVGREAGTVWIDVRREGRLLTLAVADDGVGWQESRGNPRQPLGLSLVRHMVDSRGGTLKVVRGDGVAVRVTVPMGDA
jgi:two-component sensor histidine kinase